MKVTHKPGSLPFQPFDLTLRVETEAEAQALFAITLENIDIPRTVVRNRPTKVKDEEFVRQVLKPLEDALRAELNAQHVARRKAEEKHL